MEKNVSFSLKDYLEGNKLLDEVVFEGPYGLKYISGGSGMSSVLEWSEVLLERLIHAFEQLQKKL